MVHGVDLVIDADETLALVGESGSGKTVTAQSILRLLPGVAGRLSGGRDRLQGAEHLGHDGKGAPGGQGRRDRHGFPGADVLARP